MKFFIAFSIVFFLFSDREALLSNAKAISSNTGPKDPTPATNVTVNVTWTFNDGIDLTIVEMTIKNLQSSQYAAVGLGQNQAMGEAHVFMCKRFADDKVAIQRFINPLNHSRPVPAGSEQGGVLTPLPSKFVDGIVTCQFILSDFAPQETAQPNALRPLTQSGMYHPIFAVGLLNSTGDPQYHDGREPQPGLVQLNQNQNLIYYEKNPKLFNSIHPSL